jgi:Glycosyl hydrolases family 31
MTSARYAAFSTIALLPWRSRPAFLGIISSPPRVGSVSPEKLVSGVDVGVPSAVLSHVLMPMSYRPLLAGRFLRVVLLAILLLVPSGCLPSPTVGAKDEPAPPPVRPPLTPRWVYEPWVWEDEENTQGSTIRLVDDYRARGIPVGVVIVDSPWQTNYNTFDFGSNYPDPAGLIRGLHAREVKVLLWVTGFINVTSIDGPGRGKASNYDEALQAGYFVDGGKPHQWDKGMGSAVDFFNPDAVDWWYRQMDKAWALGIDGWKVDSPEGNLPDEFQTEDPTGVRHRLLPRPLPLRRGAQPERHHHRPTVRRRHGLRIGRRQPGRLGRRPDPRLGTGGHR